MSHNVNKVIINKIHEFRNIPIEWKILPLSDVAWFQEGPGLRHWQFTKIGMKVINVTNLEGGILNLNSTERYISISEFEKTYKHFSIDENDIVMASSGATYCKIATVSKNDLPLMMNTSVIRFKSINELNHNYLYNFLDSPLLKRQIDFLITGGAQPNFGPAHLKQVVIPIPSKTEQKAISTILTLINKSIYLNNQLLKQKVLYKHWLIQNVLSGKKRFYKFIESNQFHKTKIGNLPVDWKVLPVSKIVERVRESFIPEPNQQYQEIGIRSHCKGIFYKEPVSGKSLGNKSVFWIKPECFIVNIVFAWEHAVAKTTINEVGMIASHRFPMYKPKENIMSLDFLLNYFKTPRGKYLLGLASPGGAGRNKTLGQKEFMELKIPVPQLNEQIEINKIIQTAEKEIELLNLKLDKIQEQKKGLMQQLLTGKKRFLT